MNKLINGVQRGVQRYLIVLVAVVLLPGWSQTAWSGTRPAADDLDLEKIEVLDLKTAAKIALADNPSLAAAQARVGQAQEAVRQARSTYWPRVDLTASQARVDQSDNAFLSQEAISRALGTTDMPVNPDDLYSAGLSANWLLFDGFSRWFNLAAARHGEQSTAAARDDVQRLLLQAVSSAFVSAQLSLENIAIAKADEAFNQRQLTEARLRHKVGTGALSDVLNFEVKANSAQSDLIVAERAYKTSRIGLAALLGVDGARLPENTRLEPLEEASQAELHGPELDPSQADAQNRRPDLLQNEFGVRQAEADVKSRKGDYYPNLSVVASYDAQSNDDFGFESEDFGSSIGLNLSYNIFSGGLTHARHQQAKLKLHEAEKRRQDVKINVANEVQTTTQRVISAQKQLVLQRTNARLVQKNRDLVEKEYKAGVGSLVRLNEAQRDLTAAQVRLATAQVALRQAWYDLWSATGQIKTRLLSSE